MSKRVLAPAILAGAVLLSLVLVPAAGAQPGGSVNPNPVAFAPGQQFAPVTVNWSGQTPNKLIYVDICKKLSSDPTFNPGQDCAPLSSINPFATPTGSGTTAYDIFRGPDPSGDQPWGCFAAEDVAPAGIEKFTTCYVRITNDSLFNTGSAFDIPFTIVEDGGVIPEAPVAVLLPLLAAAVLVGGFVLVRRRQALA